MESVVRVMSLRRHIADAFGAATVSLLLLLAVLGLLCIVYSIYFRSQTQQRRRDHPIQLRYFNGPWLIRIAFILVAILWGFGELIRLRLLKGRGRIFTTPALQDTICKFYVISNIGFAEPSLILMLVFLLRSSLQKKESGALSHRWDRRVMLYVFLICFPIFILQLVLVFSGPVLVTVEEDSSQAMVKLNKYFTDVSSYLLDGTGTVVCLYPLINTLLLGLFDAILISYLAYLGFKMLTTVINKSLHRRIYVLVVSVISLLLLRVSLLGVSVLPRPGGFLHETFVFIAFSALLSCTLLCIWMLVYCPIADSLALRDLEHCQVAEEEFIMPFDDYYCGGADTASVTAVTSSSSSQM